MSAVNLVTLGLITASNLVMAFVLWQRSRWLCYAFCLMWTAIGFAHDPGSEGLRFAGQIREWHQDTGVALTWVLVALLEGLRLMKPDAMSLEWAAQRDLLADPVKTRRASFAVALAGILVALAGVLTTRWIGRPAGSLVTIAGGAMVGFGAVLLYIWSGPGRTDAAVRRRRARRWFVVAVLIVEGLFVMLWFLMNDAT